MRERTDDANGKRHALPDPDGGPIRADHLEVIRLVILIPDQGADGMALARRIRQLAAPCDLDVLLVCAIGADRHPLADGADGGPATDREPAVRLRLATLAALIRHDRLSVTTQVVNHQPWVETVRRLWQPGDVVICCAEHYIGTATQARYPLHQALSSALDIPVYVVKGVYADPGSPPAFRATRVIAGIALALFTIGLFLALAQIGHHVIGLAQALAVLAISLVGFGAIAFRNPRI